MPNIRGNPAIVSRYDGVVAFLSVRPQRIDPAVNRVALGALVIPRVMRLEMMPLAPHVFAAQLAHVKLRVRRVFGKYLIAVGPSVVLDV